MACESPEDGDFGSQPSAGPDADNGPSAWPEWTCNDFPEGPEAAADYFASNGGPATLDPDGDGTACEPGDDYFGDLPPSPASLLNEGEVVTGTEINFEDGETTDDATGSQVSYPAVTQLPTTGAGVPSAPFQPIIKLLAGTAIALVFAGVACLNGLRR
jgi:hypothetical protein